MLLRAICHSRWVLVSRRESTIGSRYLLLRSDRQQRYKIRMSNHRLRPDTRRYDRSSPIVFSFTTSDPGLLRDGIRRAIEAIVGYNHPKLSELLKDYLPIAGELRGMEALARKPPDERPEEYRLPKGPPRRRRPIRIPRGLISKIETEKVQAHGQQLTLKFRVFAKSQAAPLEEPATADCERHGLIRRLESQGKIAPSADGGFVFVDDAYFEFAEEAALVVAPGTKWEKCRGTIPRTR